MDTLLLLIAINFLTVPFLQEAEAQGHRLLRFPSLPRILRLAHVRSSHWFRPFCILAFFFLAAAGIPAQAGRVDVATLLVHFVIMQVVLWAVVVRNVRRACQGPVRGEPGRRPSERPPHRTAAAPALRQ